MLSGKPITTIKGLDKFIDETKKNVAISKLTNAKIELQKGTGDSWLTTQKAEAAAQKADETPYESKSDKNIFFSGANQPNGQFVNSYAAKVQLTADEINELIRPANHDDEKVASYETKPIEFQSAENAIQYIKLKWMTNNGTFGGPPPTDANIAILDTKLNALKNDSPQDALAITSAPLGISIAPNRLIDEFLHIDMTDNVTQIITDVTKKKFLQNPTLGTALLETKGNLVDLNSPLDDKQVILNTFGKTLETIREELPELKKAAEKTAEDEKQFTLSFEKLNKSIASLNSVAAQFSVTNKPYADQKFNFDDSSLQKDVKDIQNNLLSKYPADAEAQEKIKQSFAALGVTLQEQHIDWMQGTNNISKLNDAFKTAQHELKDIAPDLSTEFNTLKSTKLKQHIEKQAEAIKAGHDTAYSQKVSMEMAKYTENKGSTLQFFKPINTTRADNELFQDLDGFVGYNGLEKGIYKREGLEGITIFLDKVEKDGKTTYSATLNSGVTDKDITVVVKAFETAMKHAIDLLRHAGTDPINPTFQDPKKITPDNVAAYLSVLESILKAASDKDDSAGRDNRRQVHIQIDPTVLSALKANAKDNASSMWKADHNIVERLSTFETQLKNHNDAVTSLKEKEKIKGEKAREDHARELKSPSDLVREQNEQSLIKQKAALKNIDDKPLHAKNEDQINVDQSNIKKLQDALKEIEKQQRRLEKPYTAAKAIIDDALGKKTKADDLVKAAKKEEKDAANPDALAKAKEKLKNAIEQAKKAEDSYKSAEDNSIPVQEMATHIRELSQQFKTTLSGIEPRVALSLAGDASPALHAIAQKNIEEIDKLKDDSKALAARLQDLNSAKTTLTNGVHQLLKEAGELPNAPRPRAPSYKI